MKRCGLNLVEVVVILATLGATGAIVYPALRPRPLLWSQTVMPPLHFQNTELQDVVFKLHRELYGRRKMDFLELTKWSAESLKHRKVTLETKPGLTLKQVLSLVEKKADVVFESGGSCGNCGLPTGNFAVVEAP